MADIYSIGQCSSRRVCMLRIRIKKKDIKEKNSPSSISLEYQNVLKGDIDRHLESCFIDAETKSQRW